MIEDTTPSVNRPAVDLVSLAALINSEHEAGELAARERLQRYRNVGLALIKAKGLCKHGEWLPWLEKNVKFSAKHAQRYMAFAKCDVTSLLEEQEEQWREISGNSSSQEQEEGEEVAQDEPEQPAPAPRLAAYREQEDVPPGEDYREPASPADVPRLLVEKLEDCLVVIRKKKADPFDKGYLESMIRDVQRYLQGLAEKDAFPEE